MHPAHLVEPASASEVAAAIRSLPRAVLRGAGTKPALAPASPDGAVISLRRLSSVVAYHPLDFTITALAGTPLAEIESILTARGQCLPFDPPCLSPASTAGGCAAAALEGPGAYQGRGVRDHVLAVQFCNGAGLLLRTGARVLKNSAGLDLGRFLAGSLGRFAALTEITFRTRPLPEASATIAWPWSSFDRAVSLLRDLAASPLGFEALDLAVPSPESPLAAVLGRISGREAAVPKRAQRIVQDSRHPAFCLSPEDASALWNRRLHLGWVSPGHALVKVPATLATLPALDKACAALEARRAYTHAGRLAWIALPAPALLESALHNHGLKGLLVLAPSTFTGSPFLGRWPSSLLMRRLKSLFDPDGKFPPWPEAEPS